jgi:HD-GYP domain-containing protein (c-di-GMP phosphodiesterase class II)
MHFRTPDPGERRLMKVVRVDDLSPGQTLGQPLRNHRGRNLLSAGVRLSTSYINRLRAMGVTSVYVTDADTSDITPPQAIPDERRQQIEVEMSDAFEAVARLAGDNRRSAGRSEGESFGATNHASKALVAETARTIAAVARQGEQMIEMLDRQEVILGLNSLKSHDNYTFQHSIDVAITAVLLARRVGWDAQRLRAFGIGCLLHDIGKVFIDTAILNKPGRLTEAEAQTVQAHPLLGYNLIKTTSPALGLLVPQVALQHHERQDGTGYPRQLHGLNRLGGGGGGRWAGEWRWMPGNAKPGALIHDFGSLSAVADVYDALSSDRPYRAGYHPSRTLDAIADMSGTHLNSEAVDILRRVMPPFPVCSEVRVLNGRYAGYTGIIASVPERDITRPVVRVLNDASGERVDATEVNLAIDRDVRLAPIGAAVEVGSSGKAGGPAPASPSLSSNCPNTAAAKWVAAGARASGTPLPPAVKEFLEQFDLSGLECVA